MASGKKPDETTLDLFGPRASPAAPPPRPPEPPASPPPPGEPAAREEPLFADEEPPPLELLDLTGDGLVPLPPAIARGIGARPHQDRAGEGPPRQRAARPPAPTPPDEARTYRVAEIVRLASRALEARFADVWVEGEVSNLKAPGHCYFTLKDAEAQLPAVMFRTAAARLKFRLADGLMVRARGRLSVYDVQGKLQLYVESIEPAGLGALQLAFEQLKRRLEAEGLFDATRKRPLPFLPRRIGVATSASGAAVRDIVRVATRRGPARLLIAPCLVQGEGAPVDIVRAIRALERQPDVDLIIVGRGGGSLEDLAAFNDEAVARAIAACRVPVISAVGHEVDFTIADFVADRRAATPSQAAELAVPVHAELVRRVEELAARLGRAGRRTVADARLRLDAEAGRSALLLQRNIEARRRALRAWGDRLAAQHPRARLGRDRAALDELTRRLGRPLPERLARSGRTLAGLRQRLDAAMLQTVARRRRAFASACGKLDALSPLQVLQRGYGLVRGPAGEVVTRAAQLRPGDPVSVRLAEGGIGARVERVDDEGGEGPEE